MRLYGRLGFKKFSGGDTPGPLLPGGGDPSRTFSQHGLRPCAGAQEPRMLRPPRNKNPPRIWADYGPACVVTCHCLSNTFQHHCSCRRE